MIRHIVLWRLKDEADGRSKQENLAIMQEKILALKDEIDLIIDLEVELNQNFDDLQPYDIALHATYENLEDLAAYQIHPAHLEVVQFIRKVRTDRACVDYEIK
jgi:hypothetical protein